jgi:peptidoglycan/xylan/chitin deacetylase (PgdA/CDA1 family)
MVHKIHLLRAHIGPGDFLCMLKRESREQGVELEQNVSREAATFHYKYDTAENARLKYLLNFTLDSERRDRLMEACFQKFFSGREAGMSRDLYMDIEQIRNLSKNACVGSHAHEHLPLGLLSEDTIWSNLLFSVERLCSWTGRLPFAFSYPYGSREACSTVVAAMAARCGFDFAFTMERAANTDFCKPLFLARFDNNDLPGGKAAAWPLDKLYDLVPRAAWYA